jgi:hypothetical protein
MTYASVAASADVDVYANWAEIILNSDTHTKQWAIGFHDFYLHRQPVSETD